MARGVKRSPKDILTEQLNKAQEKLDKATVMKKEAETEIKEISQKLKEIELDEIRELMQKQNITVDDLKDILKTTDSEDSTNESNTNESNN